MQVVIRSLCEYCTIVRMITFSLIFFAKGWRETDYIIWLCKKNRLFYPKSPRINTKKIAIAYYILTKLKNKLKCYKNYKTKNTKISLNFRPKKLTQNIIDSKL